MAALPLAVYDMPRSAAEHTTSSNWCLQLMSLPSHCLCTVTAAEITVTAAEITTAFVTHLLEAVDATDYRTLRIVQCHVSLGTVCMHNLHMQLAVLHLSTCSAEVTTRTTRLLWYFQRYALTASLE
jgi:hypothetical protein